MFAFRWGPFKVFDVTYSSRWESSLLRPPDGRTAVVMKTTAPLVGQSAPVSLPLSSLSSCSTSRHQPTVAVPSRHDQRLSSFTNEEREPITSSHLTRFWRRMYEQRDFCRTVFAQQWSPVAKSSCSLTSGLTWCVTLLLSRTRLYGRGVHHRFFTLSSVTHTRTCIDMISQM